MVDGQQANIPCSGCPSHNGCLDKSIHYKESQTMDLNEKSVVKIDGDGTVVKCAKSLPGSECGYQADTKVCGKCGAMAVEIKMVPVDAEDEEESTDEEDLLEETEEEAPMENGKPMLKTKGAGMWQTPKATRRAYTASMQDGLYRPAKGDAMMPEDDEDEEMYMDDEESEYMDDEEAKGMYEGGGGRRPRPPFPPPYPTKPRGPQKPGGGARPRNMAYMADEMMDDEEEMYMDDEENMGMEDEGKMAERPGNGRGNITRQEVYPGYSSNRRSETMWGPWGRRAGGVQRDLLGTSDAMPHKASNEEMYDEEDEMYLDDENAEYMMDEEGKMYAMPTRGDMGHGPYQKRRGMMQRRADAMMPEDEEDEMYMDDEEGEADNMDMAPDLEAMRMARLRKLGTKSADVGMNGYMCAIDRKVYPGAASVCDDCPGGCMAEKGMPGLLHVEGLVEVMFKGDVIDSGYSQDADMYVVDVETKSGSINEVFVDGTSAEVLGFHRLDDSVLSQKSIMDDIQLIDFNEAADIAVKSIPGSVVAVEPAVFEGFDSYQVEIDGVDGKSYDVFVALDGETLGYDSYNSDETAEIEAEAAEIALKRAFSEDKRQEMAKEGTAMSDGSFPIASENDLRNAIMAHGRAKDPEAAKAHIKSRAAALGLEAMLPEDWKAAEKSSPAEEFIQSLVEFEMLTAEVENPSTTK